MSTAVASLSEPVDDAPNRERRQRVLKGATIIGDVDQSEIKCVIRNQHEHGAGLLVDVSWTVPEDFLLYVPVDGIGYRCRLRWRRGDKVGVSFHGTAPKPRWHYG